MRFIIHQQPYERAIASGTLHYERDGTPTGAVEHFRMTAAVDGYRFLRVDLDGRLAPSGRTVLYHVTLNPDGRPQQVKFHAWGAGLGVVGVVTQESAQWFASRTVDGLAYEDQQAAELFWFPSATGLAMLCQTPGCGESLPTVTLAQETAEPAEVMALREAAITVEAKEAGDVTVGRETYRAMGYDLRWDNERRAVWLHDDGYPLRVWRDDGLIGVARQLVIYH